MATELSSTVACRVGVEEDRLDGLPGCSRRCLGRPRFLLELWLKGLRRVGALGRACGQRSSAHWSPVPSAYLGTSRALVETQGPDGQEGVCWDEAAAVVLAHYDLKKSGPLSRFPRNSRAFPSGSSRQRGFFQGDLYEGQDISQEAQKALERIPLSETLLICT